MLTWNVYVGNFNSGRIEKYNIFDHWSFYDACLRAKKEFKDDKEKFAEEVRRWLGYFFWGKCEWEAILSHWPDGEINGLRVQTTAKEMKDKFFPGANDWMISHIDDELPITVKSYRSNSKFYDEKIDVYGQVRMNWDVFVDYLWDHRNELKRRKHGQEK